MAEIKKARGIIRKIFLLVTTLLATQCKVLVSDQNDTSEELDYLISLELQRVKFRLTNDLGLTEQQEPSNSSNTRIPESAIQFMLAEEGPVQQKNNLTRVFFFPSNGDFTCQRNSSSPCQRFEYEIVRDAVLSLTDFCFQRVPSPSSPGLAAIFTVLCARPEDDTERAVGRGTLPGAGSSSDWTSRRLPGLAELGQGTGDIRCAVEVSNYAVNTRDGLPFLRTFRSLDAHSRARRSDDEEVQNVSCQTIPFAVHFDDIGFHDIVYPDSYQAKLCKGDCMKASTYHEVVLGLAFTNNESLQRKYGRCWATCCKPRRYDHLRVIYRQVDVEANKTKVTFVDRTLLDMMVESCWCG